MVDGLRAGHISALYLNQVVGQSLGQSRRTVLQAAHQDVGRRALEGKNRFARRAEDICHLNDLIGDLVPVLVGGSQGLLPGVIPGPGHEAGVHGIGAHLLRRHAVGLQIPGQSVGVGNPFEDGVLKLQKPGVARPCKLQRLCPEDSAAAVDFAADVVVLIPGKDVSDIVPVVPRRLIKSGICGERFCPLQAASAGKGHTSLNGGRRAVFDNSKGLEKHVACNVSDVGAWIAQHGQISPGVPLVLPGGGDLVSDILVNFIENLVSALLGGLVPKFLNQGLVDGNLDILVILSDGLFQFADCALGGV